MGAKKMSNVRKPEIFFISDRSFGGYYLGTGVNISYLFTLRYSPLLILVLMMSFRGLARYMANIGHGLMRDASNWGMSSCEKDESESCSELSASNWLGMDVSLSAIFSILISSPCWSWEDIFFNRTTKIHFWNKKRNDKH